MKTLKSSILLFASFTFIASASPIELHISVDGNDSWDGSIERPFKSLEKARDTLRAVKADGGLGEGATVFLHEGVYELEKTFVLNGQDSGTPDAPIVYTNWKEEGVRIIGGRRLSAASLMPVDQPEMLDRLVDQSVRGKLRWLDLKKAGIEDYGQLRRTGGPDFRLVTPHAPMELFVDGKAQQVARYPNKLEDIVLNVELPHDKTLVSNVPLKGVLGFNLDKNGKPVSYDSVTQGGAFAERSKHWTRAEHPMLDGCLVRDYAWVTTPLASIVTNEADKNVKLNLSEPIPVWETYKQKYITRFRLLNLFEEIDQPGEYWVDRNAGRLYIYPPDGMTEQSELAFSMLEDVLIACEDVSYVTLRGLTLEITRSSGLYIEGGAGVVVENCEIRNTGLVGIQIGRGWEEETPNGEGRTVARQCSNIRNQLLTPYHKENGDTYFHGGRNHRITSCLIHGTGRGGVILGGGDRKSLEPGGNVVEHCHIYDVSRRQQLYSEQVLVHGVGNIVRNNLLDGNPGGIIYWAGNDHLIEYNQITRGATFTYDGGVCETRQNPSFLGNRFQFNTLYNNGRKVGNPHCLAVYLDNNTCGNTLEGNLFIRNNHRNKEPFWRGMISVNGGVLNNVINNFFFENTGGTLGDGKKPEDVQRIWRSHTKQMRKDVDVTTPPYSERYPEFAKTYAAIMSNQTDLKVATQVTHNVQLRSPTPFGPGRDGGRENNLEDKELDPGFIDLERGNFHLRADSPVYSKLPDFKRIPFELIGPFAERSATRPNLDGVTGLPPNSSLYWAPARLGAYQELYLGKSKEAVLSGAPETKQARPATSAFTPSEPFEDGATYYWRVASFDKDGQLLDEGRIWSFTVQSKDRLGNFSPGQEVRAALSRH